MMKTKNHNPRPEALTLYQGLLEVRIGATEERSPASDWRPVLLES